MKLSLVDLSPVPRDGTATDAFANTVETAQRAEALGFERVWVAEHHGRGASLAGTTPEVLLGRLAGATDSIRLGSGAVLLNHYSPYKVAEVFATLDALAPGRIDAGLGQANGSPAVDRALQTSRRVQNPNEDHTEKIEAVVSHLSDQFPDDHPYSDIELPRSASGTPAPWVLGSSPSSGEIAGKLGLPYCFAGFIRPGFGERACQTYRDSFEPSDSPIGVDSPTVMVALNAIAGDTDEEAARYRAVAEASYQRMQRGDVGARPTVKEAIDELGSVPEPTPTTLDGGEFPRAISGSPETLAGLFGQLTDRLGAEEVMLQQIAPDHETKLRSHELIAEAVSVGSRLAKQ